MASPWHYHSVSSDQTNRQVDQTRALCLPLFDHPQTWIVEIEPGKRKRRVHKRSRCPTMKVLNHILLSGFRTFALLLNEHMLKAIR